MKLQGKSVLVLPDSNPDKTKGGVAIPRTAKTLVTKGRIVKVGPGCLAVKAGDRIQYNRGGCSFIEIDGVLHHFIVEDRINVIYIK